MVTTPWKYQALPVTLLRTSLLDLSKVSGKLLQCKAQFQCANQLLALAGRSDALAPATFDSNKVACLVPLFRRQCLSERAVECAHMEPHELILSEVHVESCPPGRHAWVTEFFYTEGYQSRHEQPYTGCATVEQARSAPACRRNSVHHMLRQV